VLIGIAFTVSALAQEDSLSIHKIIPDHVDSFESRQQDIQDSLLVRENFRKDSIARRQQVLDSLDIVRKELQVLLEACQKIIREEIFLHDYEIQLSGDTALGDYTSLVLPFSVSEPFTPWKVRLRLAGDGVNFSMDRQHLQITSLQIPLMNCVISRDNSGRILVLHERGKVQKNGWGQFYITPIDSVFYGPFNNIVKIKRYALVYSALNGNQRGTLLFLNLVQVKQYEYGQDRRLRKCQIVKFCDRWRAYERNRVCSIVTFEISGHDSVIQLTRRNDPANNYSDGTFTYEFDDHDNLKGISFQNLAKTEDWQRTVELNKDGNVHCYFDKVRGVVQQSICMIYHLNDPLAKYQVETITTLFEKDGISYYQKNNTTGKFRTRDNMTLEWSPWK
jgi:hypothetical protein